MGTNARALRHVDATGKDGWWLWRKGGRTQMNFDVATLQPGQICIDLCVLAIFSVAAIARIPAPFIAHQRDNDIQKGTKRIEDGKL